MDYRSIIFYEVGTGVIEKDFPSTSIPSNNDFLHNSLCLSNHGLRDFIKFTERKMSRPHRIYFQERGCDVLTAIFCFVKVMKDVRYWYRLESLVGPRVYEKQTFC